MTGMHGPDWAAHVRTRLSPLHLPATRENEIVEELSQHLDDRWHEAVAGGASPEEATELALAGFSEGNLLAERLASLRQAHARPAITPGAPAGSWAAGVSGDARYAARMLRRQPGVAVAAIVTLALAIGATTGIFAVVDSVLLRSLPFPDADRIVQLVRAYPAGVGTAFSVPKLMGARADGQPVFVDVGAYSALGSGFTLSPRWDSTA